MDALDTRPRESPDGDAAPPHPELGLGELLWRRRQFLIHRGYQLRVTLLTSTVVFFLLLALNLTLYSSARRSSTSAVFVAPELRAYFEAQDRFQFNLILLGSVAVLVGVFLLGILETHRTAGASYNICRCLEKLGEGRYPIRLRLRRGDNLHEIEAAFNRLAQKLHESAIEEASILDRLASAAKGIEGGAAGGEITRDLENLAERKRQLVE